jgi:methionyl-tRNA formyltransferase
LATSVLEFIYNKTLVAIPQNEALATYSLWRDEEDYSIDWATDSNRIKRFIDATGFPYKAAKTTCEGITLRIIEAEEFPDLQIVNRTPGKILFLTAAGPVIVCGKGLLLIKEAIADPSNEKYIFRKLRIRLK